MPRRAISAVERSLELKKTPHLITDELLFSLPDDYRRVVGRLIGAAPERIAVINSATSGIMLVVGGLDWRPGDEVVIPAHTFPANQFPWRSLEERGVRVVTVADRPSQAGIDAYAAAITDRTRVVSVTWVSYSNGLRRNLAALGELCRERGALFVVDGTQGVGGLELEIEKTPCDLLTCAGYKWMLGPYGVGFACLQPELIHRLKTRNINWLAIRGAENFNQLSQCDLDLVPTARRFDSNETASFFNLSGAVAAAEYLLEVTPAAIERHVTKLVDRLVGGLPTGFLPVSSLDDPNRSNIVCIASGTADATRAAFDRLRAAGVWVSLRENAIRISPNIYNTSAEIDRVLEVIRDA